MFVFAERPSSKHFGLLNSTLTGHTAISSDRTNRLAVESMSPKHHGFLNLRTSENLRPKFIWEKILRRGKNETWSEN
jgi:hypothetical protein